MKITEVRSTRRGIESGSGLGANIVSIRSFDCSICQRATRDCYNFSCRTTDDA